MIERRSLLNANDADFSYDPSLAKDALVTLKELEKLGPWQLLNTRASVATVNECSTHCQKDGVSLERQGVIIRDSTSCCTLCLYTNDVKQLEEGKSYIFKNLRLRQVKSSVFLNTCTAKPFEYRLIEDIGNLVDVPNLASLVEENLTGKVCGVSSIKQFYCCSVCGKKGELEENIVRCLNCDIRNKFQICCLSMEPVTPDKWCQYQWKICNAFW